MSDKKIRQMILDIIKCVDYDIYKDFINPEDPETAEEDMLDLIKMVREEYFTEY